MRRAFEIEEALDPEHTLPDVAVIPDPTARIPRGKLVPTPSLIIHEGNTIGNCVVTWDKANNARWFHGITIDENRRGQGFGLAAYKEVIEQSMIDGCDFRTEDWSQTESAKKLWEHLAGRGVAEAISEFTPDGNGRYAGEYVVRATKQSTQA